MRLLIPLSSANQGSRTVGCMGWSSWSTVEHILSPVLFPTAVSNTCVYLQLWLHFNITQLFLPPPPPNKFSSVLNFPFGLLFDHQEVVILQLMMDQLEGKNSL